jgi:hypothetical protein
MTFKGQLSAVAKMWAEDDALRDLLVAAANATS